MRILYGFALLNFPLSDYRVNKNQSAVTKEFFQSRYIFSTRSAISIASTISVHKAEILISTLFHKSFDILEWEESRTYKSEHPMRTSSNWIIRTGRRRIIVT